MGLPRLADRLSSFWEHRLQDFQVGANQEFEELALRGDSQVHQREVAYDVKGCANCHCLDFGT